MAGKNQHVVPHGGEWAVRGAGNSKATAMFSNNEQAVEQAREISQNQGSELIVHGRNGKIQFRDSHGHDPCPPKG